MTTFMKNNIYLDKLHCGRCNSYTAEWVLDKIKRQLDKQIELYDCNLPILPWKCWYCGAFNYYKLDVEKRNSKSYYIKAQRL